MQVVILGKKVLEEKEVRGDIKGHEYLKTGNFCKNIICMLTTNICLLMILYKQVITNNSFSEDFAEFAEIISFFKEKEFAT